MPVTVFCCSEGQMWGVSGSGGLTNQDWTNTDSPNWDRFDNQSYQNGVPVAVWIQVCVFALANPTLEAVRQIVANTREHAPGAYIYISGQPLYEAGHVCELAGARAPETTDQLAREMAEEDPGVTYAGTFGPLGEGTLASDDCHANTDGEDLLGRQAKDKWGQP